MVPVYFYLIHIVSLLHILENISHQFVGAFFAQRPYILAKRKLSTFPAFPAA
jgi:hypothetical protein